MWGAGRCDDGAMGKWDLRAEQEEWKRGLDKGGLVWRFVME